MKERLLTSLITAFVVTTLQAQVASPVPKLVVGLTIDQLRTDYIEAFSGLYGEKGFKRLIKEGRVYCNAEYDFVNIDRSSAVAAIYTGSTPYYNGIVGNQWMDRNSLRLIKSVDDSAYMGVYTSESSSPKHLVVSSLSDELMVATKGIAEVYSIAPTREVAILSAGHASKAALWLNDINGKWCGSTYYGEFPSWASVYNDKEGLNYRIDNLTWEPCLPTTSYKFITSDVKQLTFKHNFADERFDKYKCFKTSPYVNDEVNRLVEACLSGSQVGKDEIPDLLALSYYAGNYNHRPNSEYAMEIQDMYVRLDRSIADLLEIIDRKVGLHNTLLFITTTGYSDSDPKDPSEYKIPGGEFHIKRCGALLNMYLMAIYGPGEYVETYYGNEIYLNHKLIEKKKLDLTEILNRASNFIVQMSGVKDAYSSQRLILGSWAPQIGRVKNSYHPNCSGDIYVEVMPGWSIVDEYSHSSKVMRNVYTSAPLVFFGANTKPDIIYTPVKIGTIAPTVAHYMRIRAPNAASTAPLIDIRK
ncbi:alkaline phosphatase family protein [uncultured Bacteroides sp.]|uniref:alkaline phosphatase family protein n=1 Tax=uncultured Bacteroides sp. TaxID=162156 RepID=UPI002620D51C|nr:alkaline phosphatase family protein [uncultured Bacteroides sp.]